MVIIAAINRYYLRINTLLSIALHLTKLLQILITFELIFREVSKIVGEPVVNVRKLKAVRTVKASNKTLNIK